MILTFSTTRTTNNLKYIFFDLIALFRVHHVCKSSLPVVLGGLISSLQPAFQFPLGAMPGHRCHLFSEQLLVSAFSVSFFLFFLLLRLSFAENRSPPNGVSILPLRKVLWSENEQNVTNITEVCRSQYLYFGDYTTSLFTYSLYT